MCNNNDRKSNLFIGALNNRFPKQLIICEKYLKYQSNRRKLLYGFL